MSAWCEVIISLAFSALLIEAFALPGRVVMAGNDGVGGFGDDLG